MKKKLLDQPVQYRRQQEFWHLGGLELLFYLSYKIIIDLLLGHQKKLNQRIKLSGVVEEDEDVVEVVEVVEVVVEAEVDRPLLLVKRLSLLFHPQFRWLPM